MTGEDEEWIQTDQRSVLRQLGADGLSFVWVLLDHLGP
jgi:hypothetical protein